MYPSSREISMYTLDKAMATRCAYWHFYGNMIEKWIKLRRHVEKYPKDKIAVERFEVYEEIMEMLESTSKYRFDMITSYREDREKRNITIVNEPSEVSMEVNYKEKINTTKQSLRDHNQAIEKLRNLISGSLKTIELHKEDIEGNTGLLVKHLKEKENLEDELERLQVLKEEEENA